MNAEMVDNVTYSQSSTITPPTNVIAVTGFSSTDAKGGGLGVNLGTDFTYFFTTRMGVRGGLRYNHAHVTVKNEPLSKLDQKLTAGGPTLFLGGRYRFGK
jgi:hypothetical protein